MAPVVYFQGGFFHAHVFYAFFQFAVEDHAGGIKVFVVHTIHQHKMTKNILGNILSPRHLVTCKESVAYLLQKEIRMIVRQIAQGHVGIEKFHGFTFCSTQSVKLRFQHGKLCHTGSKISMNFSSIVFVGKEMQVMPASRQ